MKIKNLIFVTMLAVVFFSCEKDETFRIVKFDADKTCATNITQTTAVLQTSLIEVNPGDCGLEGFIYFEYADYPEYFSGHMKASGGLNRFWEVKCETDMWMQQQPIAQTYSANISDLTPGTTYYFAPVIDGTRYYGEVKSFTTLGEKSITVTTGDATNIGINCATLNGKCTLKNGATLKEAGILLNTSSSISLGNYITKFSGTRTSFSAKPDDLLSNTTYYYCAYAIEDNYQVFWGDVKSFKTLPNSSTNPTLSDYLGTYDMYLYTPTYGLYKTWTGVEIRKSTTGSICVSNLPYHNNHAYGEWDETQHNIILSNEYCCLDDTFQYTGYTFIPIFTPCYYTKDLGTSFYHTETEGSSLSYVCLTMQQDGKLALTPSKVGKSGYYSNAFLWDRYYYPSWEHQGYYDIVSEVSLTKVSSSVSTRNNLPAQKVNVVAIPEKK